MMKNLIKKFRKSQFFKAEKEVTFNEDALTLAWKF